MFLTLQGHGREHFPSRYERKLLFRAITNS